MGYFNTYIVPTAFTVFLHVIVLFFVLVGWQMSDTQRYHKETPRYVKAQLVTLEQKTPKPARKTIPPPKPVAKPAPKPVPVKPKPAPVVPKPKPEPKPEPVVAPKPDPAIERERQRQQEREQRQAEMAREMAEEEMMMQAEEDELLADSYAALVKRTVEGYWSRPASARKNMQVELSIRLIPTGEVVGVEVIKSSGNQAFDRSAVQAVQHAARFPELKDMPASVFDAYFRRFTLVFKPEDLLL